jgi:hypothetical protein
MPIQTLKKKPIKSGTCTGTTTYPGGWHQPILFLWVDQPCYYSYPTESFFNPSSLGVMTFTSDYYTFFFVFSIFELVRYTHFERSQVETKFDSSIKFINSKLLIFLNNYTDTRINFRTTSLFDSVWLKTLAQIVRVTNGKC